eukprot:987316-Pleurochrysis_carterae.AAC.1
MLLLQKPWTINQEGMQLHCHLAFGVLLLFMATTLLYLVHAGGARKHSMPHTQPPYTRSRHTPA